MYALGHTAESDEARSVRHQTHSGVPVTAGRQAAGQLSGEVDLVTIMIGGNDVAFSRIVKFCATHFDCADDTDWLGEDADTTLREWADQKLATLPLELQATYAQIVDEATNARVLVIGYPNLFSSDWTFSGQAECLLYDRAFSDAERADINTLTERFNATIASAAVAAGAEYVHLAGTFTNHETCGQGGQWLDFVDGFFEEGTFHPTERGQRVIARVIGCYLNEHSTNPHPPSAALNLSYTTVADALPGIAVGVAGDDVQSCALNF